MEFGPLKKSPIIGEKKQPVTPCETPRQNGSNPALPIRKSEIEKKHIRRDGRR